MFKLSVVTPVKVFYEEEVNSVVAPGVDGYLGILTSHAPLITALQPGVLTIKDRLDTVTELAIAGGFLEVSENKCMILADAVEYVGEIDLRRAEAALKRAQERIAGLYGSEDVDFARAHRALVRALNRLNVKSRLQKMEHGR
ncbi:MAG TPA: ATP synthase F1 subunit epsilon [candidate division Zixibacteria bacterium]|nr:ATP synthase F1 subunit epsilon [candidate division Zixibacteria bacterium]